MLLSVRDAIGAPIPGSAPVRATQPPHTFREVLRDLRARPTATGVSVPAAGAARLGGTSRTAAAGGRTVLASAAAAVAERTGTRRTSRVPTDGSVAGVSVAAVPVARMPGAGCPLEPAASPGGDGVTAGMIAGAASATVGAGASAGASTGGGRGGADGKGAATAPSPVWQARLAAMRPDYTRPAGTVRPLRGEARAALVQTIHVASEHAGLDPALTVAVARAESGLDPTARSYDGKSVGTFQVTHATAAEMRRKVARGDVERPPGHDDVALGVGYLRYLHDLFSDRRRLGRGLETTPVEDPGERRLFAVAAYNAGEGRVAQAQARAERAGLEPTRYAHVKAFLPAITRAYVERVRGYADEPASAAV